VNEVEAPALVRQGKHRNRCSGAHSTLAAASSPYRKPFLTIQPLGLLAVDHHRRIGTLARLDGDRSIFTFNEAYLTDEERPTLSLAYRDQYGAMINAPRASQTQIEPFFSNLLPEGTQRDYLAWRAGIKPVRE